MNRIPIVMYHYVRDLQNSRYPNIKGLDLKLFREQISFLKENFNVISIEEVVDSIEGVGELPEKSIVLTFDDGYIDHYTNVFPILMENNISAFFSMPAKILAEKKVLDVNKIHFVLATVKEKTLVNKLFERLNYYRGQEFNVDTNENLYSRFAIPNRFDNKDIVFMKMLLQAELPERLRNIIVDELFKEYIPVDEKVFSKEIYMSYEQVKTMKRCGMTFGIHGYDHSWLGKMSRCSIEKDIDKALDFFDDIVDRDNWIMCYPYGSYNKDTLDVVKNRGCTIGLTTDFGVSDIDTCNKYKIMRLDTNDFAPKSNNYVNYI